MSAIRALLTVFALSVICHTARAAEKPAVQFLDADGVKIAYFVQGEGEPVILLHGWLASAGLNWTLPGISGKLAEDFQVVALDVRGHGQSDKPKTEDAYGPELVEDVVRLMDHLKIEKAHIVGYSMGGIIAANFIVKHPERVLSGTLGGMGWLKQVDAAQWGFAQIGQSHPDAHSVLICGRSLSKLALTEDELKSIQLPMTVLIGDNDNLIKRLYVTDKLAKIRPDWPLVEIKNANHLTCIIRPQFRDEIVAWLKQNAAE